MSVVLYCAKAFGENTAQHKAIARAKRARMMCLRVRQVLLPYTLGQKLNEPDVGFLLTIAANAGVK